METKFPSMTLSWKPCFQVWPFYGNHVFKYDPFMETMFSSMALLWKPCFQVWPFYGNHVFKYDPFMETMFSSMALLWKPCFLKYGHSMDAMFSKYGFLMEIMFFEVWHFDETCSSVTILKNRSHIRTHQFFWKWHLSLEAQHDLNPCFRSMVIS